MKFSHVQLTTGRWLFRWSLILLLGVLYVSCAEEDSVQDIDSSYMESEEYSDFEQRFQEEILSNEQNTSTFAENLEQLSQCKEVQEYALPFVIDQQRLDTLQQPPSEACIIESHQKPTYSVKLLGKNTYRDLKLYWILLDRPSVYRNQGLFVATYQNDSLLNYNSVGSYEDDLSKEVTSHIRVRQVQDELIISSTTQRKIIYPFEQENTIEDTFTVTPKGEITIRKQ